MSSFKIEKIEKPGSTSKTIRIPNELLERINSYTKKNNCKFTDFMISAINYALKDAEKK